MTIPVLCKVDSCDNHVFFLGLCSSHYYRLKTYGRTDVSVTSRGAKLRWLVHAIQQDLPDVPCLEWPFAAKSRKGYGHLHAGGREYLAHRIAWSLHNQSDIPVGLMVLHSCDNPRCVNPHHLHLGTGAQNMNEAVLRGRRKLGHAHHKSKLTQAQVRRIRDEPSVSLGRFAAEFSVSKQAIALIRKHRNWKHEP